jgi:hypothetical protein
MTCTWSINPFNNPNPIYNHTYYMVGCTWRQCVPLKYWHLSTKLHSITTQKTTIWKNDLCFRCFKDNQTKLNYCLFIFFLWLYSPIWALVASMKLSISFRLLDLGQSAGLLGRVISSSQGLRMSAPGECEAAEVGGMNSFGRGNRSTRIKPAPTPLCPPQIPLAKPGREDGPLQWEASN